MAATALAFGGAVILLLLLIGLGVTELLSPSAEGFQLVLAPVVGLAILELGFQWFGYQFPPYVVLATLALPFGGLSLAVLWLRRSTLLGRWRDGIVAGLGILVCYMGLLTEVFARGFFTLAGWPSDNVFIYVQAARYLVDHPVPLPYRQLTLENPGAYYFISAGVFFPGSVGPLDAAVSVISGWPVHALFDPLTALGIALTAGPVWFLVRFLLGASYLAAVTAVSLFGANQLLYWVMGSGFQQEALALPVFVTGLCLASNAFRTGNMSTGALAGMVSAPLLGVYFPIASLFAICVCGCLLAHVRIGPRARRIAVLRSLAATVASGMVLSSAAAYVLLVHGAISTWLNLQQAKSPAGGVSHFPELTYLVGTLPFAHVWEANPRPLEHYEAIAVPALKAAAAVVIAMLVIGLIRAVLQKRAPEAAMVMTGLLFVAYEGLIAQYAYGYVKTIGYLVPLTSAFVAYGFAGPALRGRLVRARSGILEAMRAVGIAALVLVLAVFLNSDRDMVRMWLTNPPTFQASDLRLSSLTSAVPVGASVLVDDPVGDYWELVKIGALVYFLPDRPVRVYAGRARLGTYPYQDDYPRPCGFDFVIGAKRQPGAFELIRADAEAQLNVYRRVGPGCD